MDKKISIKEKLNPIFCGINKRNKKYSEVWLSDIDFGGLYQAERFILNVKVDFEIDGCKEEIDEVLRILDKEAKEELKYIWQIRIYSRKDEFHCESGEILVYSDAAACP